MKFTRNWQENLIRTWRIAYHEKEKMDVGDQWQAGVMRQIRGIRHARSRKNFF